jgi:hypothetical protein
VVVEVAMVVEVDAGIITEMVGILVQTGINMVEIDHVLTESVI